jgi:hypothetical protein
LFAYGPGKAPNPSRSYSGANINQLLAENQFVFLVEQFPNRFHKNNLLDVPDNLLVVVIKSGVTSRTKVYEIPPTNWSTIAARYPVCFLQGYVRSAASRTPFCVDSLHSCGSVLSV